MFETAITPPSLVRLLYVDDLEQNLYAMSQLLGHESYRLDVAKSANEALSQLLRHSYACILCDVQMPDMSGYELVRMIRQDPEHAETPVLFITAHNTGTRSDPQAFDLGAFDYLPKPIDAEILRAKLAVFAELRRRADEVAAEKELFESAMASLNNGVVIVEGGSVSYVNAAMRRIWPLATVTSQAAERFCSLPLFEAETKATVPPELHPFALALAGEAFAERCYYLQATEQPGGSYWAVSAVPASRTDQGRRRMVVVVRDVTDAQHVESALRAKNRDLEQFAYAASHDLKAPIRHISVFAGILEQLLGEHDNAEVRDALRIIAQATKDMGALVDGLLAFSTAGAQGLHEDSIALSELFSHIWDTLRLGAPDDAELELAPDLPIVWGDLTALRLLVSNLLANAIKFRSPERPLRVAVRVEVHPVVYRILVSDNGIGIPPEHRTRVFKVFQRLHAKREFEGSGIGLALCQKVVELHRGSICIVGDEKDGTTVAVDWPRSGEDGSRLSGARSSRPR